MNDITTIPTYDPDILREWDVRHNSAPRYVVAYERAGVSDPLTEPMTRKAAMREAGVIRDALNREDVRERVVVRVAS